LTECGILGGGSLREFVAHELPATLRVDFQVTEPIFLPPTDPKHSHLPMGMPMVNRKSATKQLPRRAFSLHQNAIRGHEGFSKLTWSRMENRGDLS
jgi:hypothetical protein